MPDNETRYYRFGGLLVRLDGPAFQEAEYLTPFCASAGEPALHFTVVETDQIDPPSQPERHRMQYEVLYDTARVVYSERTGDILLRDNDLGHGRHEILLSREGSTYYGSHLVMHLMDLPRYFPDFGGVFLHASYIISQGRAILFTAPKQTGKSTQAALWAKYRGAEIINGDRVLLRKSGNTWRAWGSPYCGSSKICRSADAPIGAVVLLGQAPENRVRPAAPREALAALLDGCSYDVWDHRQVETVLTLAGELVEQVPMVRLDCLPEESAVCALEEFL